MVETPSVTEKDKVAYALLDLSREEHRGYYAGFSNRALADLPLPVDLASFDPHAYTTYRQVNARFAAALKPLLRDDDLLWIHDYHLVPLAGELRRLGCRQGWASSSTSRSRRPRSLRPCPAIRLGRDLTEYDVVGLHTAPTSSSSPTT